MRRGLTQVVRIAYLLGVFLIYSFSMVLMKLASRTDGLSLMISYVFGVFGILGIYAFLWQQILKVIPLAEAFMFKSITVVYGMFFAAILFKEEITFNNIIGAVLIMIGIIVFGWKA